MINAASRWLVGTLVAFSLSGFAADPQSTWVFDSIAPKPAPSNVPTDEEQVYTVILDQVRYWNAHDIEHYMDTYWKSPDLLAVVEGEQIIGWAGMLAAYQRGYPDRREMGAVTLQRAKLQKLSPEFFLALTWFTFTTNGKTSYCTDTMVLRKFPDGWKIISTHSSFLAP
jgi:ketosteroid isomerase-like protein